MLYLSVTYFKQVGYFWNNDKKEKKKEISNYIIRTKKNNKQKKFKQYYEVKFIKNEVKS